jgi:hypothetical protein
MNRTLVRSLIRTLVAALTLAGLLATRGHAAPGTGRCPAGGVCFFAVGDTGSGAPAQLAVAGGIRAKCAADGCAFGVLLGDLIYPAGAASPADPALQALIAAPYGPIGVPVYLLLGNHDYAKERWEQAAAYTAFAAANPRFLMPGGKTAYAVAHGPVLLLALDSQPLIFGAPGAEAEQATLVRGALAAPAQPWRIVAAHHPYLSNGIHGNAGRYDGRFWSRSSGRPWRSFLEREVCGRGAQVFLAGHDHNRQVLPPVPRCRDVQLHVVSGAGGSDLYKLPGSNPAVWQSASLGFAYFRVTPQRLEIEMVDAAGRVEHTSVLTR